MTPGPALGADVVAHPLSPPCGGPRSSLLPSPRRTADHPGGLPPTPGNSPLTAQRSPTRRPFEARTLRSRGREPLPVDSFGCGRCLSRDCWWPGNGRWYGRGALVWVSKPLLAPGCATDAAGRRWLVCWYTSVGARSSSPGACGVVGSHGAPSGADPSRV